jgi:PAS domain S-box-containing protein
MSDTETLLQNVFDTISTGIFVVMVETIDSSAAESITFRFVTANPAYVKMLSLPPNALVGLSPHDCFPPDIADRFCANYSRCLEQRQPISYQESFEVEGERYRLITTLSPRFEADGRISQIIGSSQVIITECQQTEEALFQEKELLSTLIKNAPIGIISTDESGKILLVNPAFEKICGYAAEELIGQRPPYPYWDLADLDQIAQEFEQAMSGKKEYIELWFTRKNGDRFLARLQPITIFDELGNMLRHLATMEDITKYKQAEEELYRTLETERELNELKSRFVAMVSHEYRTPLTTILSSAELLERYVDQFTEEKRRQHYTRIQSAVHLLTQLVNDVLTISKIEAGKQGFNPSPLDLVKFCRELVEEFQLTIGSLHTLIFTSHGNALSEAQGSMMAKADMDEKLLRYIISNLLSNAIKYSPEGTTVRFDLSVNLHQAILSIQDTGIGIPLEDQPHLFESFYRGTNVGTLSGTGLGLAIVKSSVDLQGGKIAVSSEVGVGTTVTVTLPLNYPRTGGSDYLRDTAEGVNSKG